MQGLIWIEVSLMNETVGHSSLHSLGRINASIVPIFDVENIRQPF